MAAILYIKANAKPEEISNTYKISNAFIHAYQDFHPGDKVRILDLYAEGIKPLSAEDLTAIFETKNKEDKNHPILKYAHQFAGTDKFIIAAPMWNLSIPSILKCYIDYICVSGITFKYTENGPVGLCHGKKAIHITSRGGFYSSGPTAAYEMGDRYLRTLFGFLGITDFATAAAEKLDIVGEDRQEIITAAIKQVKEMAKDF